MSRERQTSARTYIEVGPPEIWQKFFSAIDLYGDATARFSGEKNGKEIAGVAIYGIDEEEGIERILIIRLTSKGYMNGHKQVLLERWPSDHFYGQATVASMVDIRKQRGFFELFPWEPIEAVGSMNDSDQIPGISIALSEVPDTLWRNIALEILTTQEAVTVLKGWFSQDFPAW